MVTTSEEIKNRLWAGANELRGAMDASRYKDYMLGLMFYKFLSDKTLNTFAVISGLKNKTEVEVLEEYTNAEQKYGDKLFETIQKNLGYYVSPEYLYQSWMVAINKGKFEVQKVTDGFNNFERTIASGAGSDDFKGLFANSTLDLSDTALGSNLKERSDNIQKLIKLFSDLDMVSLQSGDVLGNAYEYLIGMFAMESGKKAGEFYTPRKVSTVLAKLVTKNHTIESVYDPCVGSGSLLLTVGKQYDEAAQKNINYYGQEKNTATYNLTRMNLLLHGVRPEKMTIKNGDTLGQDWPEDPQHPDEGVQFDAVVMNPPYSAKNWNKAGLKPSDPRFESFGGMLPPSGKGDYAFLLHGLYHLGQEGTMAIVLPHGVLFRGAAEGEIRKRLIEKNNIDTVIGMPANMFTNTPIPVCVIVLKKNRKLGDPLLIIDASNSFVKAGKQNDLQEKDIAKIIDTYANRSEIEGYSHLVSREELVENDYNLNIPRYVESGSADIPQDVDGHLYGGIPECNINSLKALNTIVPDILYGSLKEIRKGYFELNKSIEDLTHEIMTCEKVESFSSKIRKQTEEFTLKYWNKIKSMDSSTDVLELHEEMLKEMKDDLVEDRFVDEYAGYQVIADIWDDGLMNDSELIRKNGFYGAGRMRIPNMVSKGTGDKKRTEQDGWIGAIVPNELVAQTLYADDQKEIGELGDKLSEVDSELSELLEAAKSEDTDESGALGECIKDSGDSFDNKQIKAGIKEAEKGSSEYNLLKKAESLISSKAEIGKEIKGRKKKLSTDVQDRIDKLTDEEIDKILFQKWFGATTANIVSIFTAPIQKDLETLNILSKRYADTIDLLDLEMKDVENELNKMLSELVVTE